MLVVFSLVIGDCSPEKHQYSWLRNFFQHIPFTIILIDGACTSLILIHEFNFSRKMINFIHQGFCYGLNMCNPTAIKGWYHYKQRFPCSLYVIPLPNAHNFHLFVIKDEQGLHWNCCKRNTMQDTPFWAWVRVMTIELTKQIQSQGEEICICDLTCKTFSTRMRLALVQSLYLLFVHTSLTLCCINNIDCGWFILTSIGLKC